MLAPGVTGRALRSVEAPGTAYDDDVLGKDLQPAHMDDFVVTDDDPGGVPSIQGSRTAPSCSFRNGLAQRRADLVRLTRTRTTAANFHVPAVRPDHMLCGNHTLRP
jgi:hypothetical protein